MSVYDIFGALINQHIEYLQQAMAEEWEETRISGEDADLATLAADLRVWNLIMSYWVKKDMKALLRCHPFLERLGSHWEDTNN